VERGRRHWWQVDHLADDEPTADVPPDDVVEAPVEERHDIVEYDLSDWRVEQGNALMEQLEIEHIPNQWVGRHLTVPGGHEAKVDELIDLFDDAFSRGPDDVEYEFPDWTPQQRQQLVDRLLALEVGCTWDGNLLAIAAADEATVDAEVVKIDPTFPVGDHDGDGEEESPEEPQPLLGGWGPVVGDIADGIFRL